MKSASSKLIKLLDSNQFMYADLYTISMIDGMILRFTNAGFPLIVAGHLFIGHGPIIERDSISLSTGISVDSLDVQIANDPMFSINGRSFIQAFRLGLFDGASLKLERVFMDFNTPTDTSAGTITMFEGLIVEPEIDNQLIYFSVVSISDRLAIKMPRNLYQPSCQNMLFDEGCGLIRESHATSSQADLNSSKNLIICNLNKPQGWFTQGVIEFVTGFNAGIKRTVRLHNSTGLLLTLPFDNEVVEGDTFKVYPGCDKRVDTCGNRFGNKVNFKGTPYVPIPETSV